MTDVEVVEPQDNLPSIVDTATFLYVGREERREEE
jgi:hypothetical protein